MSYNINKNGYYGEFGGAFIPEILFIVAPNVSAESSITNKLCR